jgi:hypothetical protein
LNSISYFSAQAKDRPPFLGLRIGRHFRDELRADNFGMTQALNVMRSGNIYETPECDIKTGEWKYRIEGYEPEGRRMAIVFCFKPQSLAFLKK